MKQNALVLLGATIGGLVGYAAFFWLVRQGLYGLILPGGLLGLGAGVFKTRSMAIAVICGVLALGLGLFTEWRIAPFVANDGLGYFLAHVHQLKPVTLIIIAVGALIGFWVPFRRRQEVAKAMREQANRCAKPDQAVNARPENRCRKVAAGATPAVDFHHDNQGMPDQEGR